MGDFRIEAVELGPSYIDAVAWTIELFAGDPRKGKPTVPYLSHLFSVSALVLSDGGSENEVIAGLLHDAMEDKHVSKAEIAQRCGHDVAEIVLGCSDGVDDDGKPTGKRGPESWDARKQEYLEHLETAGSSVLRVSAADKLDNARDLLADLIGDGPAVMARFNAPPSKQLWWYQSLAAILRDRFGSSSLTQRFIYTVQQIELTLDLPAASAAWEALHRTASAKAAADA